MVGTPFHALLFVIAAGIGAAGFGVGQETYGWVGSAIAFVLLTTWIRYGGVMAAGRLYRSGRKDAAWRELSIVPLRGRLLSGGYRAYFHLLRAAILVDRGAWAAVLPETDAVLAMRRTKPTNRATAHGARAKALMELGEVEEAAEHLARARSLPHKPALDRLLAEVDSGLAET